MFSSIESKLEHRRSTPSISSSVLGHTKHASVHNFGGVETMMHNIIVDARSYEIGDKVSIFSVSTKKWCDDGVIVDIDRRGQLKIAYNKQGNRLSSTKWVPQSDVVTTIRKRLTDDVCTSRTISALLKSQIDFLERLVHERQNQIKAIAEEVVKAKDLKAVLAQELAKVDGGERIVEEMKKIEGVHTEDLIEHKEVKHLTEISEGHSVSRLAESMIFALRWSIMRITAVPATLRNSDFNECVDAAFPETGSGAPYHTPAHKLGDFNFKDYGPKVFKKIRQVLSGVNELEYLEMIAHNQKFLEFVSNSRSGAFFFFSSNGRYMIKTISKAECDFLRNNLKKYFNHLVSNPESMLAKVYGLHRVKIHGVSLKFVVMESVFYSSTPRYIHQIFDLKGSRGHTRMATIKDFNRAPTENFTGTVLKDNDFVEREIAVHLGPIESKRFKEQLKADINFLKQLKVIDYSLLVGIHYTDKPTPQDGKPFRLAPTGGNWQREERRPSRQEDPTVDYKSLGNAELLAVTKENETMVDKRNVWSSKDGKIKYYIGLIDMLIQYGVKKKLEHRYKTKIRGKSETDVSVIPPDRYAKRFLDFLLPRIV